MADFSLDDELKRAQINKLSAESKKLEQETNTMPSA
jgi:hypothetical protein